GIGGSRGTGTDRRRGRGRDQRGICLCRGESVSGASRVVHGCLPGGGMIGLEEHPQGSRTRPGACRRLSYVEAIREATDQEMARDSAVVLFGLDVDDPKAIQGTTSGLGQKYGAARVFGTPLSEDAMTGAAIGMALAGLRPIHVHIRMDFLMLAMNQLI